MPAWRGSAAAGPGVLVRAAPAARRARPRGQDCPNVSRSEICWANRALANLASRPRATSACVARAWLARAP
eukprot:8293295-Lingulodinium_polyedra.AAC.1